MDDKSIHKTVVLKHGKSVFDDRNKTHYTKKNTEANQETV